MPEIQIEAEGLTKKFDDFIAVDHVNLSIRTGEILVLLGPNGAGKTTTVRMLTSILKPSEGWARVNGYDVVEHPDKVRASVGVLTEHHGLYNRMKAVEYLVYFGQLYGMSVAMSKERALELLDQFGLSEAVHKRLGEYSKGMRQKLALVRALLHQPPIILLDEPTSAMDPESAHIVRSAIQSLRRDDRTMILCTHNLVEAEELADQIAIIRRGSIILSGKLEDIKAQLLGPAEYQVTFVEDLNGRLPSIFNSMPITNRGDRWVRYIPKNSRLENPKIIHSLLAEGFPMERLELVNRSLEDVYLMTVGAKGNVL